MRLDPRLDILPQFQIRAINLGTETTLVTGTFSRAEGIAIDDRGWLFVSETESSIADIVTLAGDAPGLSLARDSRPPLRNSIGGTRPRRH
jgi:sugar lactone lactonase YvrE